jgi:hypothetical protein
MLFETQRHRERRELVAYNHTLQNNLTQRLGDAKAQREQKKLTFREMVKSILNYLQTIIIICSLCVSASLR